MSSQWNGIVGNVSALGTSTVTGASNATPIQITTSAAHGLTNGDRVEITSVQGNLAANGIFYVIVTAPTTFNLYTGWSGGTGSGAVAGTGAWTSGGTVRPRVLSPTIQVMQDGVDALDAAHLNAGVQAVADRTAYLNDKVGAYRLHSRSTSQILSAPGVVIYGAPFVTTNGVWVFDASLDAAWVARPSAQVEPADVVKVMLSCNPTNATNFDLGLGIGWVTLDNGAAFSSAGYTRAAGTHQLHKDSSAGAGTARNVLITAVISPGVTYGKVFYPFLVNYGVGGAASYDMVADVLCVVEVWRLN